MRSIFVSLILVMIGLNGKGQSVTALPDSVLSQCCLEVTLLNGNVTTVDWVFVQYITRDGTGTKLFVEYAPNFGGIQWETQIRIQDDFDDVLERSKFIVIPFTVGSTDYGINRNWIANIEENTTTGGTWIYGRFGTPTKRKFSAVEDYETMKNLLLACRPRAIVVAENGLYTEGDTVRMGGFLIENTRVQLEGYPLTFVDTLSRQSFGVGAGTLSGYFGDTVGYFGRRSGAFRQFILQGNRYNQIVIRDTSSAFGDYAEFYQGLYFGGKPYMYLDVTDREFDGKISRISIDADSVSFRNSPYLSSIDAYIRYFTAKAGRISMGAIEGELGITGTGVEMGAYGYGIGGGASEYLFMRTKAVDNGTASVGQYLQLISTSTGEVDFATIDLSDYLPIADTAAMLDPYIQGAGTTNNLVKFTGSRVIGNAAITENGSRVVMGLPAQLKEYSLVGLPTGVTKDMYWVTGAGPAWYQGARLAYSLESSASVFTAGSLIFANTNGQANQDNTNLFWDDTNNRLGIKNASPTATLDVASTSGGPNTGMILRQLANNASPSSSYTSLDFLNASSAIVGQFFSTASNYNAGTALAANSIGLLAEIASGQLLLGSIGTGGYISFVTNNITTTSERMRILSDGKIGINTTTPTTDFQIVKASSTALTHLLTNTLGASTYRMIASSNNSNIGEIGKLFSGYGGYKTLAANGTYIYNAVAGNITILNDFATGNIDFSAGGSSTAQATLVSTGNLLLGTTTDVTGYKLNIVGTGAISLPRGTVAQRPTIASSTTPMRFDTDSTALEYGESVGVWRQIATRAYARSLANSTWLKPQLEAGNVNITTTSSLNFRDDAKINIKLSTGKTIVKQSTSGIAISKGADVNLEGPPITFQDTAKSFMFNIVEKDYTFLGTAGQGNQIVFEMVSPKLAGTFRWPFAFRLDTTTSPATIRIDHGDRYASTSNPLTNLYYGAMRSGGAQASHQFVSRGSNGQVGFRISDDAVNFLSIRNSGKIYFATDSTLSFDPSTDVLQLSQMGQGNKTAAALGLTESNYFGLATNGTVIDMERKRDTTIYIDDADYDFSAALTTAQISRRYNRIIFWMTTTASAGSDSEITLHTPDVNLMQVEYLIHSVDEAGGFANVIRFGTNNAVDSTNGLVSSYFPAAGEGVHIRAGLRSGVYKYRYSN